MKLLKITTFYESYLAKFYSKNPALTEKSYGEQKAALDYDAFGLADYWSNALTPRGYEVMEVTLNAELLQRAWAKENSLTDPAGMPLKEIVIAQAKSFKPTILWFAGYDEELLKKIRYEVSSIKLVLGLVGSAIPRTGIWKQIDLILSCAPESVENLKEAGFPAVQIHHGFDPRINTRLCARKKRFEFSFVGQLLRTGDYHLRRDKFLEQLVTKVDMQIFSPSADFKLKDSIKTFLMAVGYDCMRIMRTMGLPEFVLKSLPLIRIATQWPSRPVLPINYKLKPFIKPPVFGLEMFQVLQGSKVTLNIHADSSPRFASNMRLFETTGVGTCLVTDWKENLHELFEPDKEVVVYKTFGECVEKVQWLLDHPKEREEIARAGQLRTLKEHTFNCRSVQLDEILRKELSM